jgi:hypothetical protein
MIGVSCFFGGVMTVFSEEDLARAGGDDGFSRLFLVGVFSFGIAGIFLGLSVVGWEAGTLVSSYLNGLPADRRCPVEVDPIWLDETIQLLHSSDPLGIRE